MSGRAIHSRCDRVPPAGRFEKQADQSVHLAYEVVNLSPKAAEALKVDETDEKKAVAMSGRSGTGVKPLILSGW